MKDARDEMDAKWNERRKKNLILKGLENPTQDTVIQTLVHYGITTEKEVVRVFIRQVKGVKHKEWAFIEMVSEQAVENSFGKRFHLKGEPLYLQKDRSREERRRLKEQREKQAKPDHRQAQPQPPPFPHPGRSSDQQGGLPNIVNQHWQAPRTHPNYQLDHNMGHSQPLVVQDFNGSPALM